MHNDQQFLPLVTKNITYEVSGNKLIKGIDLEVNSGGSTIILGHNGSGKSLLLKLLHGVITPTSGQVTWNKEVPTTNQYWRTFLLQTPSFFKQTVQYNIEFVLSIAGIPVNEYKTRCQQALEICGLENMSHRNTHALSGGELQKLSLARAWVLKPRVVLLDEPTVALDPPSVLGFEKIIHQFKQSNTKVIMTTHDLAQAKRLADEIIFIDKGKLIEQAAAKDFFSGPRTSQAQIFISGELI
tara:strand:+ start:79 stop:801 length:723 start_codon:yes stop_codon:yes gene_type:complete